MNKKANEAKKATINTSDIFAILRGEKALTAPKCTNRKISDKAFLDGAMKARNYFKNDSVNTKSTITTKMVDNAKGDTDFDKLVNLIIDNFAGATATKKCIRFSINGARFSCWRRVNNIRVYTNNPALLDIEWVEDTHEQGLTHSGYTTYNVLANLITATK